jgi:hypothetical protein
VEIGPQKAVVPLSNPSAKITSLHGQQSPPSAAFQENLPFESDAEATVNRDRASVQVEWAERSEYRSAAAARLGGLQARSGSPTATRSQVAAGGLLRIMGFLHRGVESRERHNRYPFPVSAARL